MSSSQQWHEMTLGEAVEEVLTGPFGSMLHEQDYLFGGTPVVNPTNISSAGIVADPTKTVSPAKASELDRFLLKPDDVIVARRGEIGRCAHVKSHQADWLCGTGCFVVRPGPQMDGNFITYLLTSNCAKETLVSLASGVTMLNLGNKALQSLLIAVPPLEEQRRIAEVLRSVDEAISANSATLDTTRQIVEKLAKDVAIGGSEAATIGQLGRIVTGRTPSPKQAELWGGDLPFVTPGDLNENEVSVRDAARTLNVYAPHGAKVLPAGSVLVTCIGSTVGKAAIARSSCATNQQINAICCDPAISGYVYLACVAAYDEIMANAGKQAVPIINKSTFSAITVPTRSRAEMVAISAMVDALDDEGKAARSALTAFNGIKSSLMTDLLSGHVRVPA